MDACDDSEGYMGAILDRLQTVHLEACEQSKPEPVALAKRLFEWELGSDWEVFHRAAPSHAHVLGEPGLSEYRRLVEALWSAIPELSRGASTAMMGTDSR